MTSPTGLRWRVALPVGRIFALAVLFLAAYSWASPENRPAVMGALAVCVVGAAVELRATTEQWKWRLAGLALIGASGVAMVALDPGTPGLLAAGLAVSVCLVRLPPLPGFVAAGVIASATIGAGLLRGGPATIPPIVAACGGFGILGLILAGVRARADTAERLLASEKAAREATAEAERYAERQRLAREIHDILAHTLSAQAVQLEGARLALEKAGAQEDPVLARAAKAVEAAQRLARDGLTETRRAVHSLRGEERDLPKTLRELAETAGAAYRQDGQARPLGPQASLTFERIVQEGLTNARKHAPGAPVTVTMTYGGERDRVEVHNGAPTGGGPVLGNTGGGYGLAGMRERAALIGGALTTGADGEGYRICLTIPRSGS
ncbi:two-component sensor histidine kinase [Actinorhabdospora filicis]|uniref:histidine kinase n=1 Tax=Actinorhabdospora filicis TaxID=1785913 RepID=A0A9W6SMA3_9ACTN|nr:histidine kinase [Actinorhabdospora filicis]GLZ79540.1 two-component sensor histidine kinase [Actinorhabdospora filicis]